MKLRAVSEILNISVGSVKTSLVRASRKMRLHLAKYSTLQKSSRDASNKPDHVVEADGKNGIDHLSEQPVTQPRGEDIDR